VPLGYLCSHPAVKLQNPRDELCPAEFLEKPGQHRGKQIRDWGSISLLGARSEQQQGQEVVSWLFYGMLSTSYVETPEVFQVCHLCQGWRVEPRMTELGAGNQLQVSFQSSDINTQKNSPNTVGFQFIFFRS